MVVTVQAEAPNRGWVMAARTAARVLAAILPLAVTLPATHGHAQNAATVARIGFLSSAPSGISEGFREGLKERGRVEGRNIIVEWRWTEGKAKRIFELAAELTRLNPDLIVTTANQPTAAVKAATDTIPIVFISAGDPVGTGLVASMARPGGNVTGLTALAAAGFSGKLIELLQMAVPHASRVAVLLVPTNADHRIISAELPAVAEQLHLTLLPIEIQAGNDFDAAFEQAHRSRADAIVVLGDPLMYVHRARIAQLAAMLRLPAVYFFRESVEAGGLMSYGPSLHDLGRRAATYVDKILNGAKPADLPVEQPTRFDLVINLKAAKALGLAIPLLLLLRADQVIE
jgi:putative ABC transport system substrate-binding protein